MQMLKKLGRLAFLVPYLVMPFCVMLLYQERLRAGLLFAYLMPLGIESPVWKPAFILRRRTAPR